MRTSRLLAPIALLSLSILGACGVDSESAAVGDGGGGTAGAVGKGGSAGKAAGGASGGGSAGKSGAGGTAGKAGSAGTGGSGGKGGAAGKGGASGSAGNASGAGGSAGKGGSAGSAGQGGSAGSSGGKGGSAGSGGTAGSDMGGQAGDAGAAGSTTGGAAGSITGGAAGSITGGAAGSITGGAAGSITGGAAGSTTGGSAGSTTGGSAGSTTGGSAGSTTGGSAGQGGAGGGDPGGAGGSAGQAGSAGTAGAGGSGAVCGNGIFEVGEACEDGNTNANDGCAADCTVECPAGGKMVKGRCYFLTTTPVTGTSIKGQNKIDGCNGPADHVADALTVADLGDIFDALGSSGSNKWIALSFDGTPSQRKDRDRWSWNELGAPRDALWATDQPSTGAANGEPCGALWEQNQGSLRLDDAPCTETRRVVCEREPICVVAGRQGWVGQDGHCYYTVPNPMTWAQAVDACTGKAKLAAFETIADRDTVGGLGFGGTWIGGKQDGAKMGSAAKGWIWKTSQDAAPPPISDVTPSPTWHPGEPNDNDAGGNGQEDCLQLYPTRRFNDEGCGQTHRPLCELVP